MPELDLECNRAERDLRVEGCIVCDNKQLDVVLQGTNPVRIACANHNKNVSKRLREGVKNKVRRSSGM